MSEPDKRCGCKHPGCSCRFPVEVRWATLDPPEQTVDGAMERVRANVVPEIEMLRDRATITDPAEWEADLTALTRVLSLAEQATEMQERVERAESVIRGLVAAGETAIFWDKAVTAADDWLQARPALPEQRGGTT